MEKVIKKIIALTLAILLSSTNLVVIAANLTEETIGKTSVAFNAYFKDDSENETLTDTKDIYTKNEVFFNVKLGNGGYLKSSKIEILDEKGESTNNNFAISGESDGSDNIKNIDKDDQIIELNQIDANSELTLGIPINIKQNTNMKLEDFSNVSTIRFSGVYVDDSGKEVNIEKEQELDLSWTATSLEAVLEQKVTGIIPFEENENSGIILKTELLSKIADNKLPVKETKIEVTVPEIEGILPIDVKVIANSTNATNGDEKAEDFTSDNWIYDKTNGKIIITVSNPEVADGTVSWEKSAQDEYIISYVYPETVKDKKATLSAKSTIKVYGKTEQTIEKQLDAQEIDLSEEIGALADYSLRNSINELSKGVFYSNTSLKYDTKVYVDVAYANALSGLEFNIRKDELVNKETGDTKAIDVKYISSIISKKMFDKILGEDGTIDVYDGELKLLTINKDSTVDEYGNIVINYDENVSNLIFKTSKPVTEGRFEIANKKEISKAYVKEELEGVNVLRTRINNTYMDLELTEPVTKAQISVSKANLSTVIKNENVEFKAVLLSDSVNYDLYKNPTLEIELPKQISDVTIKGISVLPGDEIKAESYDVITAENGNKVLKVKLTGEQKTFTDSVTKGINVTLNTDMVLDRTSASCEGEIKLKVTNEKATSYDNDGISTATVKMVAPSGVVALNTISNYKDNASVTAINGNNETVQIKTHTDARTVTVKHSIINNEENSINNVKVLGKIPNDTLQTELLKEIVVSGVDNSKVKVYYSENKDALPDLTNTENGWKQEVSDYSKVKAYMVVLEDYEMAHGETLDISFDIQIPADLKHNQDAVVQYKVLYSNVNEKARSISEEEALSSAVKITTGSGPELSLENSTSVEGDLHEGQIVKYSLKLTNIGKEDVNNIVLKDIVPEGTTYVEYKPSTQMESESGYIKDESKKEVSWNIDILKVGESITKTFEVEVNKKSSSEDVKIVNVAEVMADGLENAIKSNVLEKTAKSADLKLRMYPLTAITGPLEVGTLVEYAITAENISENTLNNVTLKSELPDGMKYVSSEVYEGTMDTAEYELLDMADANSEATKELIWNINQIGQGQEVVVRMQLEVESSSSTEAISSKTLRATAQTENNEIYTSDDVVSEVVRPEIEVVMTSNVQGYLSEGQEIEYTIKVINKGEATREDINVLDELPDGIIPQIITYGIGDELVNEKSLDDGEKVEISASIPSKETLVIKIVGVARELNDSVEQLKITNVAKVTGQSIDVTSNEVTNIIEQSNGETNGDGSNSVTSQGYKISGLAWIDVNRNGYRDSDEKLLSGITVRALDKNTAEVKAEARTDENGEYILKGLAKGEYVVMFEYVSSDYGVTDYKKVGADEDKNSDAVEIMTGENGNAIAITDTIAIDNSSVANIDIGLVQKQKFDLKLEKYITKVTMQNSKETKTYTYEEKPLAKLELDGKYINNTNIIVEYKIKITNEGEVAGYAKKVIDYLPKELKFSSELNSDWYLSGDGNLLNGSLANTKINPGETKELTLVLTKEMSEDNTSIINNKAEIYEAYNDSALTDIDSTPANKKDGEDDMSAVDLVLGIKTGRAVLYVALTMSIIVAIGVGAYFINKKVFKI